MARQDWVPVIPWLRAYNISVNATFYQLNNTRTRLASVFRVPRTGQITHLKFRVGNITTPTALTIGLYNVNANGNPTGGALGSGIVTNPVANGIYEVTLSQPVSVMQGDWHAVVIEHDGTGNLHIATAVQQLNAYSRTPYDTAYVSGAWVAVGSRNQQTMMIGLRYGNDGYVVSEVCPVISSVTALTFRTDSSPNEYGNRFTLPYPCRVWGALCEHVSGAAGGYRLVLYDGNGNDLSGGYGDEIPANYLDDSDGWALVRYSNPIEVSAGVYYITKKPTSSTNVRLRTVVFPSSSERRLVTWGYDFVMVSRTSTGSWSEAGDRYISIVPILSAFDDAIGSSGMFSCPSVVVIT